MHPAEPVKSRLLRCLSFRPGNGAHSGTRTRTGDDLNVVSLLLDYMSVKSGNPGGIRTRSDPIESRMSWPVRRQGHEMSWHGAWGLRLLAHALELTLALLWSRDGK